jgi:ABC-2 type transport system permease protein
MKRLILKDLKIFLKDRKAVILTFLLPLILITLFAFAFGGMGNKSNDRSPIPLLAVDLDSTNTSTEIINLLLTKKELSIQFTSLDSAKLLVKQGNYAAALVFHDGFESFVKSDAVLDIELFYDKAKQMEVGMIQPLILSAVMPMISGQTVKQSIRSYMDSNFSGLKKEDREKIIRDFERMNQEEEIVPSAEFRMTSLVGEDKKSNLGLVQAVAGTAILMLLFGVTSLGASILEERENGTLSRLLISPLTANQILLSKFGSTMVIAITQLVVMFLYAQLLLGLDLAGHIINLTVLIFAIAFAVSGFGIFLASISKSRQQAQSLGTLVILVMSAIGGSMVPLFMLPEFIQKIAVLSVNYWGIQGFYDVFWRELTFLELLPRIGVLFLMGTVMTIISLRLFKKAKARII